MFFSFLGCGNCARVVLKLMWHSVRTKLDCLSSELQTERSPLVQNATSRRQDRGTEHDTTAQNAPCLQSSDDADDFRTVWKKRASGKKLEMSFLHGSVRCLWCVLRNDVLQFLSHICVRSLLGHEGHAGMVSGRANRMQCGEAVVPVSLPVEHVVLVFLLRTDKKW